MAVLLRRSNSLHASASVAVAAAAATTAAPKNANGKPEEVDEGIIQTESSGNRAVTDDEHGAANSRLATSQEEEDDSTSQQKLSPTAIALVIMPLCLSVLLSALDLTIVTPAVPSIAASFQSVAGYVWIGSAFVLANTALTPVWGSVADIWGRKPIVLVAIALFLAGSLLCALSPHMDALIAGRAVQGAGASGMGTMVNVIICDTFSLRDRGLYLAITSVVWAVGGAVGPILGGVFTTRLT